MHALLSNGLMSFGTFFLMQELGCWTSFLGYSKFWEVPKQFSSISISSIFEEKRVVKHKNSGKLNCSASELLTLLPVLAHYVRKVFRDCCAASGAFLAMFALVEILHAGWSGKVTEALVVTVVEDALQKWKEAGWPFRTKNHWLLHFHQSFKNHGCCISCFSMERKHKMISRKTVLIQNTTTFEASAMQEVVNQELQTLQEDDSLDLGIKLLQPIKKPRCNDMLLARRFWPAAVSTFLDIASSARCQDGVVSAGDVALFLDPQNKWACGKVIAHFQYFGDSKTVLGNFALLEDHGHYATWRSAGEYVGVPLQAVFTSVTYAKDANKWTTLIPWRWR